ncbi:hypothetical protein GCM10009837_23340 [Streptomyces durmitorensis]|uniref:Uncharacterized protein n=1 Tax=Streptomyces durmitorensis TaxID=319947 RepID=A0ABY4PNQ2_9ACTN|nr:hypothetical protein [Streptomyces durmitorensis]UQT55042.1 hypothetical protein M4V62_08005 [Streptomyces durmitorensis]
MLKSSEAPQGITGISALMYCAALFAGVALVISGHSTPVEASGFVSPFLVIFEGVKARR